MGLEMFIDICVFLGCVLFFLMALGQLLLKKKDSKNYLFILCVILAGMYQFSISFQLFSGLPNWYGVFPSVYVSGMAAIYFAAPMTYIFFTALPEKNFVFSREKALHFIIPSVAAVALLIWGEYPDSSVAPHDYINFMYHNVTVIRVIDRASIIYAVIYISLVLRFYSKLFKNSKRESRKNLFVVILFCAIVLFMMAIYAAYNTSSGFLHYLFKLRYTFLAVFLFLLSYRYPFLVNIIKLEAYRDYYIKSQINNIETGKILSSFEALMNENKLFLDSTLTVKRAAEKVGVSVHQLSEILNTGLGITFTGYVKEKRIVYAQQLLVDHPKMPVLTVAMECGFNSISSFNTAFREKSGFSPTEYRRKNLSGDSK